MTCNAFVLGGGGVLGAAEVGMARALLEAGICPDLVCGTSIGAINGAAIAADPTPEGVKRLLAIWDTLADDGVLDSSLIRRVAEVMRRRTSLHGNDTLRRLLRDRLPAQTFEDLAVPFECVAASIERAREHAVRLQNGNAIGQIDYGRLEPGGQLVLTLKHTEQAATKADVAELIDRLSRVEDILTTHR
jgi:predicted acylesterase/phospholipase RssA